MELTEKIEVINQRLIEHFGLDTVTGDAIWRVVWGDDQFEWRHGTYEDITPAGIYQRTVTETRWVPKYRQWAGGKYILEKLVIVPEASMAELPATKTSYESLWVFDDKFGNPLPPKWEAIKFIIDTVNAVQYGSHLKRYIDPEENKEESLALKKKRIDGIVEELFGEQSFLEGRTKTGEAVIVTKDLKENN